MGLLFEWDPRKARQNLKKHEISFDEASTAFRDPSSVTIEDPMHSDDEERFVLIGQSIKALVGCGPPEIVTEFALSVPD